MSPRTLGTHPKAQRLGTQAKAPLPQPPPKQPPPFNVATNCYSLTPLREHRRQSLPRRQLSTAPNPFAAHGVGSEIQPCKPAQAKEKRVLASWPGKGTPSLLDLSIVPQRLGFLPPAPLTCTQRRRKKMHWQQRPEPRTAASAPKLRLIPSLVLLPSERGSGTLPANWKLHQRHQELEKM